MGTGESFEGIGNGIVSASSLVVSSASWIKSAECRLCLSASTPGLDVLEATPGPERTPVSARQVLAKAPMLLRCLRCIFCSGFGGTDKGMFLSFLLCVEMPEMRAGQLHKKPSEVRSRLLTQ